MRGIKPPALFELRAHEWRNAVDSHHTPFSGSPLFSKQVRLARPVDIPNWSTWGDLHSQGCSILSRTGLLFPINHTPAGRAEARSEGWSATRDLHTEGAAILSRRGLLFPLKPVAVKWWA